VVQFTNNSIYENMLHNNAYNKPMKPTTYQQSFLTMDFDHRKIRLTISIEHTVFYYIG